MAFRCPVNPISIAEMFTLSVCQYYLTYICPLLQVLHSSICRNGDLKNPNCVQNHNFLTSDAPLFSPGARYRKPKSILAKDFIEALLLFAPSLTSKFLCKGIYRDCGCPGGNKKKLLASTTLNS